LNSSFGEFAGFTDVAYHASWIQSEMDLGSLDPTVAGPIVATPEPTTTVLMASGLLGIAGFVRRRRKAA
ncbi:MAG: PEP-CTERM sorting domain-containing protein, partial [Gemmatimonadaceae bacterium]